MKKIDKLVLQSFIGPYILSFFVAEFVLVMMFLWKYIDVILGKGFSILEILELLGYYAVSIIPMAMPISILIASVMVFGDLSEKYELSSMKSAGVSLLRVMRPGIMLALFTALFSLLASNYMSPKAMYQFKKRFMVIRQQKSSLSIEEGIFNDDFRSFVIRAKEKGPDGKLMKDVLIYDHTKPDKSLVNLISADRAKMYTTSDGMMFIMELEDGSQYQEDTRQKGKDGKRKYPFMRTSFDKYTKVLDMSEFYVDGDDMNISRSKEDMMNSFQLIEAIDSSNAQVTNELANLPYEFEGLMKIPFTQQSTSESENISIDKKLNTKGVKKLDKKALKVVTELTKNNPLVAKGSKGNSKKNRKRKSTVPKYGLGVETKYKKDKYYEYFYETMVEDDDIKRVIGRALTSASSKLEGITSIKNKIVGLDRKKEKLKLKLHQQFSFAAICIIFLFIGAPLGSIIRKGGYGYPLLVAILFYMLFMIMNITGAKLLKSGSTDGLIGGWLSCIVLLPLSILFTYQAVRDVKFNTSSRISSILRKYFKRIRKKDPTT